MAKTTRKEKIILKNEKLITKSIIKSPLNYIGGKFKLLQQILPLFPRDIDLFVDLFAGGCNVGINANAKKIWFNDNLIYLIDMYESFQDNTLASTIDHIESRIKNFNLSLTNAEGYKKLRALYNTNRNPLDLFVLIAFTFNHQIRFNNSHEFNNPFGKERSSFNANMKQNLQNFILRLKSRETIFTNLSFNEFDYDKISRNDFVYCDPPYLITTGSYNDGRRGFKGWSKKEESQLLEMLNMLNKKSVRFALSNVLEHKGKINDTLKEWLKKNTKYIVHHLEHNYSNSNYHTKNKDKNSSKEVLITNY